MAFILLTLPSGFSGLREGEAWKEMLNRCGPAGETQTGLGCWSRPGGDSYFQHGVGPGVRRYPQACHDGRR
jgi:hypothetical protein